MNVNACWIQIFDINYMWRQFIAFLRYVYCDINSIARIILECNKDMFVLSVLNVNINWFSSCSVKTADKEGKFY